MAAQLVYIKTVSLLPRHEEAEELKKQLQGQLLQYDLCQRIAKQMGAKYQGNAVFVRTPPAHPGGHGVPPQPPSPRAAGRLSGQRRKSSAPPAPAQNRLLRHCQQANGQRREPNHLCDAAAVPRRPAPLQGAVRPPATAASWWPRFMAVLELCRTRLPDNMHIPAEQIQVLTPTRKGPCGTVNLNRLLQDALNPKAPGKRELTWGERGVPGGGTASCRPGTTTM